VEFSDVDARGQRGQHPQVRRASLVVRPVRRAVEQRPIHRREFLVLVVDVKGVVGGEANPGHVGQSGGTAWQESSDLALPGVHNEQNHGFCDVGFGWGDTVSREKRLADSFPGAETTGLGSVHDRFARQDC
jgi:hypothetical protein